MSTSKPKNEYKLTEKQKKNNKEFLNKLHNIKKNAVDNCKKYLKENSNKLKNYNSLQELINNFDKTYGDIIDYYNNDENNILIVNEKFQKNKSIKKGKGSKNKKSKSIKKSSKNKSSKNKSSKNKSSKKGGAGFNNDVELSRIRNIRKIKSKDLLALLFFWIGIIYICLTYQETIEFINRINSYRIYNNNQISNSEYDFFNSITSNARRSAHCNENGCTSCKEQMMYYAYFSLLYVKAFLQINATTITHEIVQTLKVEGVNLFNMGIQDFIERAQTECGINNSATGVALEAINRIFMGNTSTTDCLQRTQNNLWKKHLNRLDDIRGSISNVIIKHSDSIYNKLRIATGLFVPSVSYIMYRINDVRISYSFERQLEEQRLQLLEMNQNNMLALGNGNAYNNEQEFGPQLRNPHSLVSPAYNSNNEGQLIRRYSSRGNRSRGRR